MSDLLFPQRATTLLVLNLDLLLHICALESGFVLFSWVYLDRGGRDKCGDENCEEIGRRRLTPNSLQSEVNDGRSLAIALLLDKNSCIIVAQTIQSDEGTGNLNQIIKREIS